MYRFVRACCEMREIALTQCKPEYNKCRHDKEFGPRGKIHEIRAMPYAQDVHNSEHQNTEDRKKFLVCEVEWSMHERESDCDQCTGVCEGRKGDTEILCEPDCQSRNGSGLNDRKDHPAIEEGWQLTISFSQINVLSASMRIHTSEFRYR